MTTMGHRWCARERVAMMVETRKEKRLLRFIREARSDANVMISTLVVARIWTTSKK